MTYLELAYGIKELLFNLGQNKELIIGKISYYTIYFSMKGDLKYLGEIVSYLTKVLEDIEKGRTILDAIDEEITLYVIDMTSDFFVETDKFGLFVALLKKLNNSFMGLFSDVSQVILKYDSLISCNGFKDNNYRVFGTQKGIDEETYNSYLELIKK